MNEEAGEFVPIDSASCGACFVVAVVDSFELIE